MTLDPAASAELLHDRSHHDHGAHRSRRPLPREPARRAGCDTPRRRRLTRLGSPAGVGRGPLLGCRRLPGRTDGATHRGPHRHRRIAVNRPSRSCTWIGLGDEAFPGAVELLPAAGAGVAVLIGVAALYRGLAIGAMGIVAPISAAGPSYRLPSTQRTARPQRRSSGSASGSCSSASQRCRARRRPRGDRNSHREPGSRSWLPSDSGSSSSESMRGWTRARRGPY